MYIALIGDIISSKQIENRNEAQEKLVELMNKINDKYKNYICSPFTITVGDEFQALLKVNSPVFQLIDELAASFSPYEIRFGVGKGGILTEINKEQSIGMDGPVFWYAREAINSVHEKKYYGISKVGVILEDKAQEHLINTLLITGDFIKSKWTKNHFDIFSKFLEEGIYEENFSNTLIAELLGISFSAFSKRLSASGLKIYFKSRNEAQLLLTGK